MLGIETTDQILYETPDFRVRYVCVGNSPACFVTFDSLTDTPNLDRSGFGEQFLREQGVDAVHVISRTNVWYSYEEFDQAIERVRLVVKKYDRVLTYGSSMGGYAAIRWAQSVGAQTAIAISPQYSVSKRLVPFEYRWRSLVAKIDRIRNEQRHGSTSVTPIVFYDPVDLDALHFELISQHYPQTIGVPMPNAGHPAGAMLSETGMLSKTIISILDGAFDNQEIVRVLRDNRRLSGQYLFTLARRIGPKQPCTKRALATAAVQATSDGAYMIYDGLVAERYGDADACEVRLHEALEVLHDHPAALRAIASFSVRHGRADEAVEYASRLCAIDSQPLYLRLKIVAFALAGRLQEARYAAAEFRGDLLLCLSLSRVAILILPNVAIHWWWTRLYRIEREFAQFDLWRERLNMRRRSSLKNGYVR